MAGRFPAVLVSLCLTLGIAVPAGADDRQQAVLIWAVQELARVEGLASECIRRRAIVRHLRRVRAKLNGLLERVPPPPPPEVSSPPVRRRPPPMAPPAFGRLMDSVRAQVMTRGKLTVISTAAPHNFFSSRQVAALLGAVPFSRQKLKALKLLCRRITDPETIYVILESFPFQRDRKKAQRILSAVQYQ